MAVVIIRNFETIKKCTPFPDALIHSLRPSFNA